MANQQYDASLELWRLPKVAEKVQLGASTIREMVRAGTFPEPRRIGAQAVAWRSIDVLEWMHGLPPAKADGGKTGGAQ